MADTRFFNRAGPFRLSALAAVAQVSLHDDRDPKIADVSALDTAGGQDLSFFINKKYRDQLKQTQAAACIVKEADLDDLPSQVVPLVAADPHRAYALIAQQFYPEPKATGYISDRASVDPTAKLGAGVEIAAGAVVSANVELGDGVAIGPNCVVGAGVCIGAGSRVDANVTISHSLIGKNVSILPGACIGQRGFGFAMGPMGHEKVPQMGRVIIEDDCEIGANTCIDRGAGPDTLIGKGTMIDNLVQIAHNVQIGKSCVLAAGVGIAGSAKLGDFVVMAGKSAAAGHISLASGTTVLGNAGVINDTKSGDRLIGTPAIDSRTYFKIQAQQIRSVRSKSRK